MTHELKFKVDQQIFLKLPDAKFGAILISNIDNSREIDIAHLTQATLTQTLQKYSNTDLETIPEINLWRKIFDILSLGKNFQASHESLLKRVLTKKQLPQINPLVDIYNNISVKKLIPIGGHNIDNVHEVEVRFSTSNDKFLVMNSNEEDNPTESEVVYATGNNILTRNFVWRQSEFSKITADTKNVFIPLDDALGTKTRGELEMIAKELIFLITNYLGGSASFGIVDKYNPEITLNSTNEVKLQGLEALVANPSVVTDEKLIESLLTRGIATILPDQEGFKKLLTSGTRIKIYQGYDPSSNKLHIGNAIGMRLLEKFRKLGHHVIFLIGTATGKVGDPTDKLATRKILSEEDIENNIASWKEQASQILNFDDPTNPVQIVKNGDWLDDMTFNSFLQIGNRVTIQQLMERDMFQKRLAEEKPISVSEVLYPLMQGFDSVVLEVDAEFGGNDQLFNMLMGRTLLKTFKNKEKWVITGKLLADSQGIKMGKSLGNVINLTDEPQDIYGKVMSFTDGMVIPGFEILTDIDMAEVKNFESKITSGQNPMEFKKKLAYEVVKWIKGETPASSAQEYFEKTIQNSEMPEDIKVIKISSQEALNTQLVDLLHQEFSSLSKSEIKRTIEQGGLEINEQKHNSIQTKLSDLASHELSIKLGKRNWLKIIITD